MDIQTLHGVSGGMVIIMMVPCIVIQNMCGNIMEAAVGSFCQFMEGKRGLGSRVRTYKVGGRLVSVVGRFSVILEGFNSYTRIPTTGSSSIGRGSLRFGG